MGGHEFHGRYWEPARTCIMFVGGTFSLWTLCTLVSSEGPLPSELCRLHIKGTQWGGLVLGQGGRLAHVASGPGISN